MDQTPVMLESVINHQLLRTAESYLRVAPHFGIVMDAVDI